jgi:hypothetical protein
LGKVAQAAGLHLSESKTKEMRIHNITDTRLQLGEEEIEEVEEFVYLGSIISKRGGSHEDITARIKKAKATFFTIIIHLEIKANLFEHQDKAI